MKELTCAHCNKIFKPKYYPKPSKSGLYFCSQLCNVTYWGKHRRKSGPEPKPKILTDHTKELKRRPQPLTGEELLKDLKYSTGNPTNRYARIREHSRRLALKDRPNPCCLICGYSIYIEVCHIKAINEFNGETKLNEVNTLSNLTILCPNHHKEFDRGLLSVVPTLC